MCCLATIAVIGLCVGRPLFRVRAQERIHGDRDVVREGKTAGEMREVKWLRMPLVWIPAGTFMMGRSKIEADQFYKEDQVGVAISHGFWMGQTEVTRAQWKLVMGTTPWERREEKKGDDYPVTWVSADDAIAFCERLTADERRANRLPDDWKFDLPTEAQWEYACRAGTTSRFSFGNDPKDLGLYAWYDANTGKVDEFYAHRVKQKRPNPWNLFDMHGNVLEWCRDTYTDKLPGGTDPIVCEPGKLQTMVGGCWAFGMRQCLSAWRSRAANRNGKCSYEGFRVVLVQKQSAEGKRGPNLPVVVHRTATSDTKAGTPIPPLAEPFTMLVFQLRIPQAQNFSPETDIEFVTEGGAQGCLLRHLKTKTEGNYRVFDQQWLIHERDRRRAIMVGAPPWDEKLHITQVFRLSIPAVPVPSNWSKWQKPDCIEPGHAGWNFIYNQKPVDQSTKIPSDAFELRYKVETQML
jgi:formylglycine-generating enzyme required for sulfatase activity